MEIAPDCRQSLDYPETSLQSFFIIETERTLKRFHRVNVRIEKTKGRDRLLVDNHRSRPAEGPPASSSYRSAGSGLALFSAGVSRVFRQQPSEVIIYEFRGERNALEELI